jgi:hypothetical protein
LLGFKVSLFKSTPIGLDEFDGVDDHLEAAPVFPLVSLPFGLLQIPDDSDPGSRVEVLFRDLGVLVEAHAFDPPGFLASRFEGQGKTGDRVSFTAEKDFWVVSEVAGQDELIDHGFGSFLYWG